MARSIYPWPRICVLCRGPRRPREKATAAHACGGSYRLVSHVEDHLCSAAMALCRLVDRYPHWESSPAAT